MWDKDRRERDQGDFWVPDLSYWVDSDATYRKGKTRENDLG